MTHNELDEMLFNRVQCRAHNNARTEVWYLMRNTVDFRTRNRVWGSLEINIARALEWQVRAQIIGQL